MRRGEVNLVEQENLMGTAYLPGIGKI